MARQGVEKLLPRLSPHCRTRAECGQNCFAAGNVPIYWGATNVADYIPKECFIDQRDFASMEELYAYLKQMPKEEYAIYIDNIRSFLSSDQARVFTQEYFDAAFCEAVKD